MKKNILFSGTIGIAVTLAAVFLSTESKEVEYYQPRQTVVQEDGASDAIEWLSRRRVNQVTGTIDLKDVAKARNQVSALKNKKASTSALNLQWANMGPANNGGRTRAILIDKDDPNIMFAGCVSGGLFKSTSGGTSWTPVNDFFDNLAVVSLAQAPNSGDIYFGTGEGMYYATSGDRSRGILGSGIYKSTDGGNTFAVIPSTIPTPNSSGAPFAAVGKLAIDPSNDSRVYAATIGGLYVSDDAGDSWTKARSGVNRSTDMVVASNGNVWVKEGAVIYKSDNGDVGSYNAISNVTDLPSSGGRARIAVSPQDPNYVYVVTTSGGRFSEAWQSKDGGDNWTLIGSLSNQLDPHSGQGGYNNALAVSASNKDRIIVGGVTIWEWSAVTGWQRIGSQNDSPTNPFYVHSDNHEIVYHPSNPTTLFVGNDGGIFKSVNDGVTWSLEVKEYVTTQFYNIAVGVNGEMIGGTQDNGTFYIDPNGAQPRNGLRTPAISFRGAMVDGDGGFASISRLDPRISFKSMQNGRVGRSVDNVQSYSFVLSNDVDPNLIAGSGAFSSFVTPWALWEKLDDPTSQDFIRFGADLATLSIGFGTGGSTYTGTVARPQLTADFVPEGLTITVGQLVVTSDATGNLIGDGSGTFDAATGDFNVTFSVPVSLEIRATAAVRYDAGSVVSISSAINELPIEHTLTQALEAGDSTTINDPVQSMYFVGVTGLAAAAGAFDGNENGGVWMTRGALSDINRTPTWYQVGKIGVGSTPSIIEVSGDGDIAWVGTENGRVVRYSNLSNARDEASTSVRDEYVAGNISAPNTSVIVSRTVTIPAIGGREITDIAIHPNDPDKVVVTTGNYGNSQYVFYSSNGTSVSPTFTLVQGDLPELPVYAALFNIKSGNTNQLLVGTDLGIFVTDDISAGSNVSWTQENGGMANVPVFDLVQDRTVRFDLKGTDDFDGSVYAGTHGRGIFKTSSTANNITIGIDDPKEIESSKVGLDIYPNPASDRVKIALDLNNAAKVSVIVRDINGKLIKTQNYGQLSKEVSELELDVNNLSNGNYIITLQIGSSVQSDKLIISK